MVNEVQGTVKYDLLYRTNMNLEEFMGKFHQENIIDMKVHCTLSDGSVHIFQVCDLLEAAVTSFEINGEQVVMDDITEKERITKTGSVIQLAI